MSKNIIIILVVALIGILTFAVANFVASEFFAYDEESVHSNAVYWLTLIGFLGGVVARIVAGIFERMMPEDF